MAAEANLQVELRKPAVADETGSAASGVIDHPALESADLNIEVLFMDSRALFVRLLPATPTFQEAVQYIREGKDNEQPYKRTKLVMIAYAIVHHPFYYLIHFLSTLALMALAFWEQEAVPREENPREEKAVTTLYATTT